VSGCSLARLQGQPGSKQQSAAASRRQKQQWHSCGQQEASGIAQASGGSERANNLFVFHSALQQAAHSLKMWASPILMPCRLPATSRDTMSVTRWQPRLKLGSVSSCCRHTMLREVAGSGSGGGGGEGLATSSSTAARRVATAAPASAQANASLRGGLRQPRGAGEPGAGLGVGRQGLLATLLG
jgi:hypothetical protein